MRRDSNTISLSGFSEIPKSDQAELLSIYGECIDQVEDEDFSYTLFYFEEYFVELIQDNNGYEIVGINPFHHGPQLNKYVEFDLFDLY